MQINTIEKRSEDIELIDLFRILISEKFIIVLTILVSLVIGILNFHLKDHIFLSKINVQIENTPYFFNDQKQTLNDFKNSFYSKEKFEIWKIMYPNSKIQFNDLSDFKLIKNNPIKKNKGELFIEVAINPENTIDILIKSNDLDLLSEVYSYSIFIENLNSENYVLFSKNQLDIINQSPKIESNEIHKINFLAENHLLLSKNGYKTLNISKPTEPLQITFSLNKTILFFLILGFFLSIFLIVIKKFYKKI